MAAAAGGVSYARSTTQRARRRIAMGTLIYATTEIGIPDEHLATFEALTLRAFREGKSFATVVTGDVDGVIASRTLWLAPQIPIQFDYKGYETVQLRMDVLEVMFEAVEQGLCFIGDGPEPYELTDGDADE
jgi:hypothetical protein